MIAGAVLAGGKSTRFGRNKALQEFRGKRFVELAVESLGAFCSPVMVVANDLQPYRTLGVTLVRDLVPHQGPLGGIHTALLFSPCEWVLVKATDMPFLESGLAELIIGAKNGYDAVVPKLGEFYEPLLALYNRRCLPPIAHQLETPGERQIVKFFRKIRIRSVPEEEWRKIDPEGISFRNVNTLSDLAEIDGFDKS